MNKKIFQSLFMIGAMLVGTAGFVGCSEDYDDDIDRLEQLIDENENAINSINQLVASGSVITGVATNAEGLEITLSNGQKYTITNGVDGMNGQDAVLWTVGENDGYWYKDGVKQDFKAVGEDGVDGQDGADGVNGADGAAGGYYKPNEDGTWDLYNADGTLNTADTGLEWKVPTGGEENPLTAVWNSDGTLVLSGDATNYETIILGATKLTDLIFIPEFTLDGHEAHDMRWLPTRRSWQRPYYYTVDQDCARPRRCFMADYGTGDWWDEHHDYPEDPTSRIPGMYSCEKVEYRINPVAVASNKEDLDWMFLARSLETRVATSATFDNDWFAPIIPEQVVDYPGDVLGALQFRLQPTVNIIRDYTVEDRLSDGEMALTFALQGHQVCGEGATSDERMVVSDYAVLLPVQLCPHIVASTMGIPDEGVYPANLPGDIDEVNINYIPFHGNASMDENWDQWESTWAPRLWNAITHEIIACPYTLKVEYCDEDFDLDEHIFAAASNCHECPNGRSSIYPSEFPSMNFIQHFDFCDDYILEFEEANDGMFPCMDGTNQNDFIDIEEGTNRLIINKGTASVGRRPLIRVTWRSKKTYGNEEHPIVARAFIMLEIIPKQLNKTIVVKYADDPIDLADCGELVVDSMGVDYSRLFVPEDQFFERGCGLFHYYLDEPTINPRNPCDRSFLRLGIPWPEMNDVFECLEVSQAQFSDMYWWYSSTVGEMLGIPRAVSMTHHFGTSKENICSDNWGTTRIPDIDDSFYYDSPHDPNVCTYAMGIGMTPHAKFGYHKFVVNINPRFYNDIQLTKLKIIFIIEVKEPVLDIKLLTPFTVDNTEIPTVRVQGTAFDDIFKLQAYAGEAFNEGHSAGSYVGYRSYFGEYPEGHQMEGQPTYVPGKINCTDHRIRLRERARNPKHLVMMDHNPTVLASLVEYPGTGSVNDMIESRWGPSGSRNINDLFGFEGNDNYNGLLYMIGCNEDDCDEPDTKSNHIAHYCNPMLCDEMSRLYKMVLVTRYPNMCYHKFNYDVMFYNPFTVMINDIEFTDFQGGSADEQNLRNKVSVMLRGTEYIIENGDNQDALPPTLPETDMAAKYGLHFNVEFEYTEYTPGLYDYILKMNANMYDGWYKWENTGSNLDEDIVPGFLTVKYKTCYACGKGVKDVKVKHTQPAPQ